MGPTAVRSWANIGIKDSDQQRTVRGEPDFPVNPTTEDPVSHSGSLRDPQFCRQMGVFERL